jgi:hypothetical protein
MKKITSVFLALALCVGLMVPAFADSTVTLTSASGSQTLTISGVTGQQQATGVSSINTMDGVVTIYDVPVGATLAVESQYVYGWGAQFYPAALSDGTLTAQYGETSGEYSIKFDPLFSTSGSFTADKAGLWLVSVSGDGTPLFTIALNVTGSGTTETPATSALPFSDVAAGAWYYTWVSQVYEKGLFGGYTSGKFGPLDSMTYNQFFAVLYQFSDDHQAVTDFSYYIQWAKDAGLVPEAIADSFSASAAITRQDMAAIFGLFLSKYNPNYTAVSDGTTQYTDQSAIADYAADGVTACQKAGLMGGNDDGSFAPAATANRAQVAVTMVNLAKLMGK